MKILKNFEIFRNQFDAMPGDTFGSIRNCKIYFLKNNYISENINNYWMKDTKYLRKMGKK